MAAIAKERSFNPLREYLESLTWDGVARADTWLMDYMGVADSPLHRAYGSKFLIGAVARAFQPGCQLDHALILEGLQGLGKSTALKALISPPWFAGNMPDLHSKDATAQLQGKWLIEFAELHSVRRGEVDRVKSFMTNATDRFRPSYGRVEEDFPRQCVFAGTINLDAEGYLRDVTGARRWWPVRCGVGWVPGRKADAQALGCARDQIWAEAVARYRNGETWYLDAYGLEQAQEESTNTRFDIDVWHDAIAAWADHKPVALMGEILSLALGIPTKDQTRAHQMRVAAVLHSIGWTRVFRRIAGRFTRVYVPPASSGAPAGNDGAPDVNDGAAMLAAMLGAPRTTAA